MSKISAIVNKRAQERAEARRIRWENEEKNPPENIDEYPTNQAGESKESVEKESKENNVIDIEKDEVKEKEIEKD